MLNYRHIIFSFFLFFTHSLFSQGFVTLDWENPEPFYIGEERVETDLPGFAGAAYYEENYLPYYYYQVDLGGNYKDYEYNVKIEYPEFQELSRKETESLIQKGIILSDYPEVSTSISVSAKNGLLNIEFIPIVYREGVYQRINSFKLIFEKKQVAETILTRATAASEEKYTYTSVLSSGKWVKIRLQETGIYKITHSDLRSMGFSDPSKVRLYGYGGYLLREDFTKTKIDDLPEVPLWRERDFVLFYANGTIRWEKEGNWYVHTQNYFSSYAYYFLTEGEESPMEFPKEQSLSETGATTVTTFDDYDLYEIEGYSWTEKGRKLYDTYDYKTGNTRSYTFNIPGITNDPGLIKLAFTASGSSSSSISFAVDGIEKGSSSLGAATQYESVKEVTREISWTEEKKETTSIVLTHTRSSNVSGRLDYLRLNFKRKLALYNAFTMFRSKTVAKTQFIIDNAVSTTCVWDVSDPADHKQVVGTYSNSQYTFVADVKENSEYVVLDPSKTSFNSVEVVGNVENQNLHSLYGIDMVIIVPPVTGMITQAERLAQAHREKDKLAVEVVSSEKIYNEFSSGTPDGTAYRWFMKMLHDRASEKKDQPKYLLLFGAGSSDNRMVTSNWSKKDPKEYLLCFLSENSTSDVNSYVLDDYYGFLDDEEGTNHTRDVVDIAVGRFPVRTVTEAKTVVDKMIAYMNNEYAGAWKNVVCTLGDDGTSTDGSGDNGSNIHMEQAEGLALDIENYSPELIVKRIHWDAYKMQKTATGNLYPDVTKQILEQLNEGTLFLNYTGHGGPSSLSHEKAFLIEHVSQIYSSKPAFWVTAACDVAPFDLLEESLGEALFLHPTGGAIGLLTTARTVYSNSNFTMNKAFIKHLFSKQNNEYIRLGDAVREAKAELASKSSTAAINNLHFVFLGNPALKLDYSEYKVVIEEFNGNEINNNLPTISAGGIVNVKGYIADEKGDIVEDFDGVLYPTVLDTKETITTYNNTGYVRDPFQYTTREKVLFNGSNMVESGRFTFTFPVPLDINYSGNDGLINFYAINEDKTKEGKDYFNDFLIDGTDPNTNLSDTEGPKINLYLNNPNFVYGGKVNETPCLIAELEDEDGINTIGNGIGHDLIAIINNSENYTYILNNYYESALGDYTRGTVRYTFPELPEGKHTLLFRAWDIMNNSSTQTLDFEVVKGLKPGLFDLECTQSPAKENTTFILSHDRPGTELDIRVSVYDFSGKVLWTHVETGVSADNYYYIDWDLKSGGGQRLSPGVYLYRAAIASGGSKESTKARKIVILAQ